ncbi:MAG: mannose-1-phosphate guanylyltransferase/mannose-6-phosphate isomerase [Magnetococcales bacterium]|nr:mannose-1-phosphate guanylyltransferase/mannose-6-phosphate isomerase [Magnetococcales bacterium]
MIYPTILSGGAGTRLWPLSRHAAPKQFLRLVDPEQSLFQATLVRMQGVAEVGGPILVCNGDHRFLAAEQARAAAVAPQAILLEPVARNTAPAVACAALYAQSIDPDALLLVLPSDHLIADQQAFHQAVATGARAAGAGFLVTFGIQPQGPETGYGYIQRGPSSPLPEVFRVARFVEKPDRATAEGYLATGEFYWNAGIFLFRCDRFLEELDRHAPDILAACRPAMYGAVTDLDFLRLEQAAFAASPSDSIDYAVMEKTDRAVVVPMEVGWSDVGSWSSLWEIGPPDADGNVIFGDVAVRDVRNCYLRSQDRLLAAVGLEGHVVVETGDAVLVAPMDRSQDIKDVVIQLSRSGREEHRSHQRVYRPWGSYKAIHVSERFQVKSITVNPGSALSLQMHHHRAEHWVVVKGTARVQRGDETFLLTEDQSTYIPLGTRHRLENPGRIPLELIEVQSGSYLGEDDVLRFEDRYGREEHGA